MDIYHLNSYTAGKVIKYSVKEKKLEISHNVAINVRKYSNCWLLL